MSASQPLTVEDLKPCNAEDMMYILNERAKTIAFYVPGESSYCAWDHGVSRLSVAEFDRLRNRLDELPFGDKLKAYWEEKCHFDYDGQIFVIRDRPLERISCVPVNSLSRQLNKYIDNACRHNLEEVRRYASRLNHRSRLSMRYEDESLSLVLGPIDSWGLDDDSDNENVGLVVDVLESGSVKTLSTKVDKMMKYFKVELAIIFDVEVDGGQGIDMKMYRIDWDDIAKELVAAECFHTDLLDRFGEVSVAPGTTTSVWLDDFGDRPTGRRIFTHEDGSIDSLKFDRVRNYEQLEVDVHAIACKFYEEKQRERKRERESRCGDKRKRTDSEKEKLEKELEKEYGEHRKTKRTGRSSKVEVLDYECV